MLQVVLHVLPEDTDLQTIPDIIHNLESKNYFIEIPWLVTNLNKDKITFFPPLPNLLS